MGEQLISVDFINEMYRTFFVWIDIVLASALTKEANSFIGLSQYIYSHDVSSKGDHWTLQYQDPL